VAAMAVPAGTKPAAASTPMIAYRMRLSDPSPVKGNAARVFRFGSASASLVNIG
jgi:hypothetical protein